MTLRWAATLAVVLGGCTEELPEAPRATASAPRPKSAAPTPAPRKPGFDGVVVGADGIPVPAQLTLTPVGGAPVLLATPSTGKFSAPELPDGEVGVELRAPNEVPTKTSVYLPQHDYTLKMVKGETLTLTARTHLHDPDPEGRDGALDGPFLDRAALDVWWKNRGDAWEKIQTVEVRGHQAQVRVPRGSVYLELSADGRCGANWFQVKGDLAAEVALDGEAAIGRLMQTPGVRPPGPGHTVTVVPASPTKSACLRRTVKVGADGRFTVPTAAFDSRFAVEVKPAKGPAQIPTGDVAGGRDFRVVLGGPEPLLLQP